MNWQKHGIDVKGKTSGQIKTTCPKCSDARRDKRDQSLSVNIPEGLYSCHHCGWKGSAKDNQVPVRQYTKPGLNITGLSDKAVSWFEGRGITKATLMRFKVTESKEWMPQTQKEENCINFNYFREDKLVNIKFRDGAKNFKLVKDAELIFYNLDAIKDGEEVVICEGEIDCLSLYEAGVFNAVSVPNGASKGNQKLEYLDNCWEAFQGKKKVVIATDSDEAGTRLREELARRLGKERCWYVDFKAFGDVKDSNDVLARIGKQKLKEVIENAIQWPLEGIATVLDFDDNINEIYINGFPKGDGVGYPLFDTLLKFRGGEVTVITGIPNSGKSEFADQLMERLSTCHNWRWAVMSAENQPLEFHFTKLAEKYIGKSFFESEIGRMNVDELMDAKAFVHEHFYFIKIDEETLTLDYLIAKASELVLKKGVNGFLIDPWNYIEHRRPSGMSETEYISEALGKICKMAKRFGIHVFIVAHPTKIKKSVSGKFEVANLYDIAGSANWFNKCDNGLSVYLDSETKTVDVHIQKVRFKFMGRKGLASFTWDKNTGRYTEFGL